MGVEDVSRVSQILHKNMCFIRTYTGMLSCIRLSGGKVNLPPYIGPSSSEATLLIIQSPPYILSPSYIQPSYYTVPTLYTVPALYTAL